MIRKGILKGHARRIVHNPTAKSQSQDQEEMIANLYGGRRSPSSGASVLDDADVATTHDLMECKTTGIGKPAQSIRVHLKDLERLFEKAAQTHRWPVLQIQIYNPDSPIADKDGMVNWALRPLEDDVELRKGAV